jgi:hypothetical protein
MPSFQLVGLPAEPFASLGTLSTEELSRLGARRVVAATKPGYPCRVSLVDAEIGEELFLLPYEHQPANSPYKASGPIYVRRAATQRTLPVDEIPDYVRLRLISVRAYDEQDMIVGAEVCEGRLVATEIERQFTDPAVHYIHLHNAKRGCFSCLVQRALPSASGAFVP